MISLKKVLTVARYEFTTTVMRKSFLVIALGMPLIIVGSGMVGTLMSTRQLKPALSQTIAVVDQAKILKPEWHPCAPAYRPRTPTLPIPCG